MLRRHWLIIMANTFRKIRAHLTITMNVKALLNTANAWILSVIKAIKSNIEAPLKSQPASELESQKDTVIDKNIELIEADSADITLIKNIRIIREMGLLACLRRELHSIREYAFSIIATLISAPGRLLARAETFRLKKIGSLSEADTVGLSLARKIFYYITALAGYGFANDITAKPTITLDIDRELISAEAVNMPTDTTEAFLSNGKVVYWIEPVLENGVLKIVSVYNAEQNGDVLEIDIGGKIAEWIEPVLENGVLKIVSVYNAEQNGKRLEVE